MKQGTKTAKASAFLVALAIILVRPAMGASSSETMLRVQVQPEAAVEAPNSIAWSDQEAVPAVAIPIRIRVRLARGTAAELTVSEMAAVEAIQNADSQESLLGLEVRTPSGTQVLSGDPVVLERYLESGTYNHSVVLRLSPAFSWGSHPLAVRLQLASSDGLIQWSQVVTLPLEEHSPVTPGP